MSRKSCIFVLTFSDLQKAGVILDSATREGRAFFFLLINIK